MVSIGGTLGFRQRQRGRNRRDLRSAFRRTNAYLVKILDTDVCTEILRGNAQVISRRSQILDKVATTWITACELSYGAARSRAPRHNQVLLVEFLATLLVIGLDMPAAERFGQLKAKLEQTGDRLADADLLIAAITLTHGATLITGNLKHYQRIETLCIEDWIRGSTPTSK